LLSPTAVAVREEVARHKMVLEQIAQRDISDARVLEAMQKIPRHFFVPDEMKKMAHDDNPLPIGHEQTISQPYMVAAMTTLLTRLIPDGSKVLEIGSGSGYQTAILVHMGYEVHSIELLPELLEQSKKVLQELDLMPTSMTCGDGHLGIKEKAPYDGIIAAACAKKLPKAWKQQLAEDGVIVAPISTITGQHLFKWQKQQGKLSKERVMAVRFVPLVRN
jgi:protein-L-isoaspartate(D-aspartate) O-methyltransferase